MGFFLLIIYFILFLNPSGNAADEGVSCVREDPRCYHHVRQTRVPAGFCRAVWKKYSKTSWF